jgi:hypothetical protein
VNFDTEGSHVLLLEFTCQVALDESGLDSRGIVSIGMEDGMIASSGFWSHAKLMTSEAGRMRPGLLTMRTITCLSGTTISNQDQLEGRGVLLRHGLCVCEWVTAR